LKLLVVIPTYNEAANIESIVSRLLQVDPGYHAVVVDDNSPDGTAAVVSRLAEKDSHVHLLHRKNDRGFGTAVRDGFLFGLEQGADLIGEMDADGSHDPAMFPEMISRIHAGADLVIGSRYVQGSQIHGWGPFRYLNSHVANGLARLFTGVPACDATNGLRLFRRQVLETINLNTTLSRGYSIILETNYRSTRAGFSIAEVPITFHPRTAGKSKMGIREILRFCLFLLRLRFTKMQFGNSKISSGQRDSGTTRTNWSA
jgi:dolichol-phosphate mannosyltransferase